MEEHCLRNIIVLRELVHPLVSTGTQDIAHDSTLNSCACHMENDRQRRVHVQNPENTRHEGDVRSRLVVEYREQQGSMDAESGMGCYGAGHAQIWLGPSLPNKGRFGSD